MSSFVSLCLSVLQEKQSEMEGLKQQLVEVEKQRDEHNDTIEKLKQVTAETGKTLAILLILLMYEYCRNDSWYYTCCCFLQESCCE